jgi:phage regulator Rha-like protein
MSINTESIILTLRGNRVILDTDLASLYGVTTKRLNEQVKRNLARFPEDFMFQLEIQELTNLRSQFATSRSDWGGRRTPPYAFTEHGAVMAANVLNSELAIEASILLVRTFIKMRSLLAEQVELKKRLQDIERRLAEGFKEHENELQEIRFAIAQLEAPQESKKQRIGFEPGAEG